MAKKEYIPVSVQYYERLLLYKTEKAICVTDCEDTGLKIGSGKCIECPKFIRKNMNRKYVICKKEKNGTD